MKYEPITTNEQAWALPEIKSEMFEDVPETLADGTVIVNTRIRPLAPYGIDGDSIILFVDKDGHAKKVVATENGFAKTKFIIP